MMEEKQISDSMATITIKPDYPSSEYCSSEAPPAYHKPQSSAVQVAKIVAVTVVVVSFVLGCFILASAYVTASASCRQLEQDLELLSEVADKFDSGSSNYNNNGNNNPEQPLQPEALIQEEPAGTAAAATKHKLTSTQNEINPKKNIQEIDENKIDNTNDHASNESDEEDDDNNQQQKVHFKLPLQLDFDDLAGALIAKNQRSKMNCIVEKKRAEEVVDHQPKTVRLPFGLNLTTDPRFERLTGERMVIICESGHIQSAQPSQQAEKSRPEEYGNTNEVDDDDDDDDEQETIMIQPVMIPIPQTHFQTHMPQQMLPIQQQQQQQQQQHMQNQIHPQIQIRPLHPMETMRPPMPPGVMQQEQMEPIRLPMRPPPPSMMEQTRQPIEQIMSIRSYGNMERPRQSLEFQRPPQMEVEPQQQQQQQQRTHHMMLIPQQLHIRLEPQIPFPQQGRQQQQLEDQDSSPNPIIQHIIQQIIAQKIMESRKLHEQQQQQQQQQQRQEQQQQQEVAQEGPRRINFIEPRPDAQSPPEQHIMYRPMMPLPEEVLTNLNRLPNTDRVIVAVSEPDSAVEDNSATSSASSEDSNENSHETSPTLSVSIQPHIQAVPVPAQAGGAATAPTQEPAAAAAAASSNQKVPADMIMMNAGGNGGETYLRRLPVDIPVNMMQSSQLHDQEQEPEAVASEETRPHYVQPRSVSNDQYKSRITRSVNPLTPSKKVKRCACECAC